MSIQVQDKKLRAWQQRAEKLGPEIAMALARATLAEVAAGWSATSPSLPGTAPAIVSGELAASVQMHGAGARYQVGTGLAYGAELEIGSGRAAARPWLRPALERVRAGAGALIGDYLKREGRGQDAG